MGKLVEAVSQIENFWKEIKKYGWWLFLLSALLYSFFMIVLQIAFTFFISWFAVSFCKFLDLRKIISSWKTDHFHNNLEYSWFRINVRKNYLVLKNFQKGTRKIPTRNIQRKWDLNYSNNKKERYFRHLIPSENWASKYFSTLIDNIFSVSSG